ncbi:MAG: hypothetical protein J7L94_06350 [Caldisericaceae bacterium]|nr:hypothetical protein [Caldisericaceae bacterium]
MYHSSGKEPRAFTATDLDHLPGRHQQLMKGLFSGGQTINKLIYSPRWPGGDGIWGHKNYHASMAILLNNDSIFVTMDWHNEKAPVSKKIPLKSILAIETGHALLHGWFRIHYFGKQYESKEIDFLFNSYIKNDFLDIIRFWHQSMMGETIPQKITKEMDFPELFSHLSLPAVIKRKRRKDKILSHKKDLWLTSGGALFLKIEEAPLDKDHLTFADSFVVFHPVVLSSTLNFSCKNGMIYLQYKFQNQILKEFELYPEFPSEVFEKNKNW